MAQTSSYEAMYLERQGEIEDRVTETNREMIVRRYSFDSLADIMKYWTELEYISLARIVIEDEEVPLHPIIQGVFALN